MPPARMVSSFALTFESIYFLRRCFVIVVILDRGINHRGNHKSSFKY